MLRDSPLRLLAATVLLPLLAGCVKKSTYEGALAQARAERAELREEMESRLGRAEERAAAEARENERLRSRVESLEAELERLEARRARAETRFEEARQEVHRLEAVLNQRGSEFRRLEQQLRTLRAIEREARERNRIYQDVIDRFRSLIDGGQLSVSVDRGRLVIHLPQDVLFRSGSATLAAEGRETLGQVATVLADLDDRSFQVEGHTDDVPISTERFPSNWELSTARALSVVRLLVSEGVPPENVSGAGYGEHQPVASNATADGRRRNRRIEIVMLPNLDVIAGADLDG